MEKIRYCVVGIGASIFNQHRRALELGIFELVGASDVRPEARARADELGVPFFADDQDMHSATHPELTVILTPHPLHAANAIAAMEAGSHVLVEKPIAVRVSEADAMLAVAARTGRTLALNFQQRCRGDIKTLKRLIEAGRLGKIQHVDVAVAWPRTAAYYAGGGWRATWAGEGGGVLMNQAPHNLDLICHLFGLPMRVSAWTRTTLHNIEVEDTLHAMAEWPDGALGSIHISTAEAGRPQRLEIIGTAGSATILDGELTVKTFTPDFRETVLSSSEAMPEITAQPVEVTQEDGAGDHMDIYTNLYQALREGAPLVASGKDGQIALELANALILSGHAGQDVRLPLDRAAYDRLFEQLAQPAAA